MFLPILLYDSTLSMSVHVFRRVFWTSILLALPAVLLQSYLIGVVASWLIPQFNFATAWLLGAILAATDPVSVVQVLHELAAPERLSGIIEGESLLNDGSAFVLFDVLLKFVTSPTPSAGSTVGDILQLLVLGPLWGAGGFIIVYIVIKFIQNDGVLELSVAILAAFTIFYLGDVVFGVSSVLAVVTFGLLTSWFGRYAFTRGVAQLNAATVSWLSWIATSLLFALSAVIIHFLTVAQAGGAASVGQNYADLAILYVTIHVVRALALLLAWPLVSRMGYGLTFKEGIVMWWSGIRGVIAISLALIFNVEADLPAETRDLLSFHVSGIVVLTLIINGTLAAPLYKRLNVYPANPNKHYLVKRSLAQLDAELKAAIKAERKALHGEFPLAAWDVIYQHIIPRFSKAKFNHTNDIVLVQEPINTVMNKHVNEVAKHARRKVQLALTSRRAAARVNQRVTLTAGDAQPRAQGKGPVAMRSHARGFHPPRVPPQDVQDLRDERWRSRSAPSPGGLRRAQLLDQGKGTRSLLSEASSLGSSPVCKSDLVALAPHAMAAGLETGVTQALHGQPAATDEGAPQLEDAAQSLPQYAGHEMAATVVAAKPGDTMVPPQQGPGGDLGRLARQLATASDGGSAADAVGLTDQSSSGSDSGSGSTLEGSTPAGGVVASSAERSSTPGPSAARAVTGPPASDLAIRVPQRTPSSHTTSASSEVPPLLYPSQRRPAGKGPRRGSSSSSTPRRAVWPVGRSESAGLLPSSRRVHIVTATPVPGWTPGGSQHATPAKGRSPAAGLTMRAFSEGRLNLHETEPSLPTYERPQPSGGAETPAGGTGVPLGAMVGARDLDSYVLLAPSARMKRRDGKYRFAASTRTIPISPESDTEPGTPEASVASTRPVGASTTSAEMNWRKHPGRAMALQQVVLQAMLKDFDRQYNQHRLGERALLALQESVEDAMDYLIVVEAPLARKFHREQAGTESVGTRDNSPLWSSSEGAAPAQSESSSSSDTQGATAASSAREAAQGTPATVATYESMPMGAAAAGPARAQVMAVGVPYHRGHPTHLSPGAHLDANQLSPAFPTRRDFSGIHASDLSTMAHELDQAGAARAATGSPSTLSAASSACSQFYRLPYWQNAARRHEALVEAHAASPLEPVSESTASGGRAAGPAGAVQPAPRTGKRLWETLRKSVWAMPGSSRALAAAAGHAQDEDTEIDERQAAAAIERVSALPGTRGRATAYAPTPSATAADQPIPLATRSEELRNRRRGWWHWIHAHWPAWCRRKTSEDTGVSSTSEAATAGSGSRRSAAALAGKAHQGEQTREQTALHAVEHVWRRIEQRLHARGWFMTRRVANLLLEENDDVGHHATCWRRCARPITELLLYQAVKSSSQALRAYIAFYAHLASEGVELRSEMGVPLLARLEHTVAQARRRHHKLVLLYPRVATLVDTIMASVALNVAVSRRTAQLLREGMLESRYAENLQFIILRRIRELEQWWPGASLLNPEYARGKLEHAASASPMPPYLRGATDHT